MNKVEILSVQSVSFTTKVVSSNPFHGDVYSIQLYVIKFDSDRLVVFSDKTDHRDIIEILLKVALNTINHKPNQVDIIHGIFLTNIWFMDLFY